MLAGFVQFSSSVRDEDEASADSDDEAEVGVMLPVSITDNELSKIHSELADLDRHTKTICEVVDGSYGRVHVRQMSSTSLIVFLGLTYPCAWSVLQLTDKALTVYERFLNVKKLSRELASANLPTQVFEQAEQAGQAQFEQGLDTVAKETSVDSHAAPAFPSRWSEKRTAHGCSHSRRLHRARDRGGRRD